MNCQMQWFAVADPDVGERLGVYVAAMAPRWRSPTSVSAWRCSLLQGR